MRKKKITFKKFFFSLGLPQVYLSPQHYIFCLQTVACDLKYKRGCYKVTDNIFYMRYYFVVSPNHRLHLVDPILPGGIPVDINIVTLKINSTIILVDWGRGRLSHGMAGRRGEFRVACEKR